MTQATENTIYAAAISCADRMIESDGDWCRIVG
jgi:hypothetical protein